MELILDAIWSLGQRMAVRCMLTRSQPIRPIDKNGLWLASTDEERPDKSCYVISTLDLLVFIHSIDQSVSYC